MAKSESIDRATIKNADWDTPYRGAPSSNEGEFSKLGVNPVVADRTALTFTETSRTPRDGDMSRSQGKFPTSNSTKRS